MIGPLNLLLSNSQYLQERNCLLRRFIGSYIVNDKLRLTILRDDEWLPRLGQVLDELRSFAFELADRLHVIGEVHGGLRQDVQ